MSRYQMAHACTKDHARKETVPFSFSNLKGLVCAGCSDLGVPHFKQWQQKRHKATWNLLLRS